MKITLPIRQFLAEFYGTFILVFVGTGSIAFGLGTNLFAVAFAFGTGAMIAIYTIGHISGAHLNPVVSFALLLDKRMKLKDFFLYLSGQFLGSLFATLSLTIGQISPSFTGLGPTTYTEPTTPFVAIFFEMFATFILVYMVLAVSQRKSLKPLMGIIVAFTLVGLILVVGPVSGASFNPFRSLAPALLMGGVVLQQVWVYFVGPFLGAGLAVVFYRFLKFLDSDTVGNP